MSQATLNRGSVINTNTHGKLSLSGHIYRILHKTG